MALDNPSTVAVLREKIDRLAPLVRDHRAAFDSERRLPHPVFDALADSGLLRLWLPKALDGPELSPFDFMEVVEAASELDGSVGWIVGNGAGMSRAAGYLPAAVARSWFADPRAFIVSATGAIGRAVPTRNGYSVTGRWPFGSGSHHATRFMSLCAVAESGTDTNLNLIACYFSASDVTIDDTWHVAGLRGTGSCDWEVRDVFVPAEHCHKFPDHSPTQPGLLYRMPHLSVFAWTVSVVPLGIARSALSCFKALADHKVRGASTVPLADREPIHDMLGRAETLHAAARTQLKEAMAALMIATDAGGDRLVRARAQFRAACSFAAESAVRVVDSLAAAAGTSSIFETFALERCFRDVHAAVKHVAMSPNNYAIAGRLHLGREPGTSRF